MFDPTILRFKKGKDLKKWKIGNTGKYKSYVSIPGVRGNVLTPSAVQLHSYLYTAELCHVYKNRNFKNLEAEILSYAPFKHYIMFL